MDFDILPIPALYEAATVVQLLYLLYALLKYKQASAITFSNVPKKLFVRQTQHYWE